jgi:integrase
MQAQRPWRDDLNRNITTHGFRTTFRTYIANETDYNGEIAEFALAHKLKDKAQAPYQQGDFLEKRIGMMQDYANYAYSNPDKPRDNVSQIRA